MLCLQGVSATSGIMTLSKHKRKPQENIIKSYEQVTEVKKFPAAKKPVFTIPEINKTTLKISCDKKLKTANSGVFFR